MPALPVAAREVREASRQTRTYSWRWATAAVALAVMSLIAWATQYSGGQGHELFVGISMVAYVYCLFAGAIRTADIIAEEKRENTLGLLFLTDLKGWDVVLGKLLSSSLNCFSGLIALVPMLAIPMLMGGVPWSEFGKVVLSLVNGLLFSMSWGVLVSAVFRSTLVTNSLALLIVAFFTAGVPFASLLLTEEFHARMLGEWVFVFSPTHCVVFALSGLRATPGDHYWVALLISASITIFNLRAAIFFLPRLWHETPKNKKTERFRQRVRVLRFGDGKAKNRLRTRLLNQNPLFWLANREQVSSSVLMGLSTVVLLLSFTFGMIAMLEGGRDIDRIFVSWVIGLGFVHILIAFRMAMAATYRLSEDRRSGALELLLATEVSVRDVLRGYWLALGRQFFGPITIVAFGGLFAVAMLLMIFEKDLHAPNVWLAMWKLLSSVRKQDWNDNFIGMFSLLAFHFWLATSWVGLIWSGMWLGLRERRAGWATWLSLSLVYLPPWLVMILGVITLLSLGLLNGIFGPGMFAAIILTAALLHLIHATVLSLWARRNLIRRFREAAADRYVAPRAVPWPAIRRLAWRLAIAGACAAVLLVCAREWINRRGERIWKAALAAHPEFKLDATESVEPPIADEENLAKARVMTRVFHPGRNPIIWNMSGAQGYQELIWDWPSGHALNVDRVQDLYVQAKVLKAKSGKPAVAVAGALATFDDVIAEIHKEAALRPKFQLSAPVANSPPGMWGYYQRNDPSVAVRNLIEVLALRTSVAVACGTNSTDDLFLALRLAEGLRGRGQIFRGEWQSILDCVQPIYDGLARHLWTDEQLQAFERHFEKVDVWGAFEAFRTNTVREWINGKEWMTRRGVVTPPYPGAWLATHKPIGFVREDQARLLDWGYARIPQMVNVRERRVDATELARMPASTKGLEFYQEQQMAWAIRVAAFVQTTCDEVMVACAIERFRREQKRLPTELQELVPKFITRVPNDVFTGKPLRYVVSDDRRAFKIYSVGADGVNNDGAAWVTAGIGGLWQAQGGDWVWSESEITRLF